MISWQPRTTMTFTNSTELKRNTTKSYHFYKKYNKSYQKKPKKNRNSKNCIKRLKAISLINLRLRNTSRRRPRVRPRSPITKTTNLTMLSMMKSCRELWRKIRLIKIIRRSWWPGCLEELSLPGSTQYFAIWNKTRFWKKKVRNKTILQRRKWPKIKLGSLKRRLRVLEEGKSLMESGQRSKVTNWSNKSLKKPRKSTLLIPNIRSI